VAAAQALCSYCPGQSAGDDAVAAARAAGLHHVHDRQPGLTRRRTGRKHRQNRRWIESFRFEDAHGRMVRDASTLERIRKLAIPPAWEDVWICGHAQGHIQATGRDARGRKQYRYHPRWREERDGTKYSKMVGFGRALPGMRRRIAADLRRPGLPRRKVLAAVVRLLETTFIRVGNEEYARTNRSFGLTTLEDRHVDIGPGALRFHFRGKSGVFHQISVHDPVIARIVRRCRDLPGQELFQYLDEDGQRATIDSADVNEYIREIAGAEFTAKDFRTWAGTVLATCALRDIAREAVPHTGAARRSAPASRTPRAASRGRRPNQRDVVRAIARVAERLGNTPSVCRKCYIHPTVIESFMDGTLTSRLTTPRSDARRSNGDTALRPEESAVLALLQHRMVGDQRGRRLESQLRQSLRAARRGSRT
jgi:DNA topoisomerase-1